MKGITPIIATIILILLVLGLAGTTYMYLFGYVGPITSKNFLIVHGSEVCSDTNPYIKLRMVNTGTSELDINDIVVKNVDDGDIGVTSISFVPPGPIEPGKSKEVQLMLASKPSSGSHTVTLGTVSSVKSTRIIC